MPKKIAPYRVWQRPHRPDDVARGRAPISEPAACAPQAPAIPQGSHRTTGHTPSRPFRARTILRINPGLCPGLFPLAPLGPLHPRPSHTHPRTHPPTNQARYPASVSILQTACADLFCSQGAVIFVMSFARPTRARYAQSRPKCNMDHAGQHNIGACDLASNGLRYRTCLDQAHVPAEPRKLH